MQMTTLKKIHSLSSIEKNKHEVGLQTYNFLEKRLQHSGFLVEVVKLQEQWWLLLKTCNIIT